ncbi:MAG: DUF72 domain-containing protein [Acidobacteriota bacterium]|nr:DUF72 domain-containing protein [Acidobacteriota bacterium]
MSHRVWIGTSGYNYPEWRGTFYPDKMKPADMLTFYGAAFDSVEINYTFYRMPSAKNIESWAGDTPEDFRFVLKAPKRITHDKRLRDFGDTLAVFVRLSAGLEGRLGPLLFQLPPNLKKDLPRLEAFLDELPDTARAAFEFRHESWFDEDVFTALRSRGAALCAADSEKISAPIVRTAAFSYFRLRDEGYQDADIAAWTAKVREASKSGEVYVFFKHEDSGKGPAFAQQMKGLLRDYSSDANATIADSAQ